MQHDFILHEIYIYSQKQMITKLTAYVDLDEEQSTMRTATPL